MMSENSETELVDISSYVVDKPVPKAVEKVIVPEKSVTQSRAPIMGGRALVGGAEYTVAGWGEYEITRRRTRWEVMGGKESSSGKLPSSKLSRDSPGARYQDRNYIHADDVIVSIMGAKTKSALQSAANRLGKSLSRLEDSLCKPSNEGGEECGRENFTLPALTSADMIAFAKDISQQTDPEYMADLGDEVIATAAAIGITDVTPAFKAMGDRSLPHLPTSAVQVSNDEAVLKLESAVAPYVAAIEKMQAELATRLDVLTTSIDTRMETK